MQESTRSIRHILLTGLVLASMPLLAAAQARQSGFPGHCANNGSAMQHDMPPPPPPGMMGRHDPATKVAPAPFSDLGLNDAQEKKIAELMQAQSPAICEKEQLVQETVLALHRLTASNNFDAAKARATAESHGKAVAELSYLHAEIQSKVWTILSKEQRKQLEERQNHPPRPRK